METLTTQPSAPSPIELAVRPAGERGAANFGWLDSHHSFSFGDYYDPRWVGFRNLRVLNDDRVAARGGFPTHPHRDMEIVSYVLEGSLQHKDSLGTGSVIRPGDVQRMTAGTGVLHSEYNPSATDPVHFLQIWILPEQRGLPASYEQKFFAPEGKAGRFALIASRDGSAGSVTVHADAKIYAGTFERDQSGHFDVPAGRNLWLQVARGNVRVGSLNLAAGDGAYTLNATGGRLEVTGVSSSEVLLFELP